MGQIGLHKIENADTDDVAVSLHLYTPPWAEKRKSGLCTGSWRSSTNAGCL